MDYMTEIIGSLTEQPSWYFLVGSVRDDKSWRWNMGYRHA
jgi:hypothetical protein